VKVHETRGNGSTCACMAANAKKPTKPVAPPEKQIPSAHALQSVPAAARNGNLAVVKALVEKSPDSASEKDSRGVSPLAWAARNGHVEVVSFLLGAGADIDAVR
jgi:uncharacterized protein